MDLIVEKKVLMKIPEVVLKKLWYKSEDSLYKKALSSHYFVLQTYSSFDTHSSFNQKTMFSREGCKIHVSPSFECNL